MSKKTLIYIFGIIFLVIMEGCVKRQNLSYKYRAYEDMKDFVLNEENSGGGAYLLFFETANSDFIGYETVLDLKRELHYSPEYSSLDIDNFYKNLMLGEVTLTRNYFVHNFIPESNIISEYEQLSFNEFLDKYTIYIADYDKYILRPNLSFNEVISIAYFLYQNNYYALYGDFNGIFGIYKTAKDFSINESVVLEEIEENMSN